MFNELLMRLGGLALIIKGGDFFVAAAIRLAELLRMPRGVIGSALASLAKTTPELVVSIMAGLRGESGLAVGFAARLGGAVHHHRPDGRSGGHVVPGAGGLWSDNGNTFATPPAIGPAWQRAAV